MTHPQPAAAGTYWIETLGCPKNAVDSEKLAGVIAADGLHPASCLEEADLVVVNTCAFIEEARKESVETILDVLDLRRSSDVKVVVTGCLAERYGAELADALPEVDLVAGFGVPVVPSPHPVALGRKPSPAFDLLNLPRPSPRAPWAYLKVAEGCDRSCGFCAIPQFRGPQRSRQVVDIVEEAALLASAGVREVVLVAQDPARFGMDREHREARERADPRAPRQPLVRVLRRVAEVAEWVRVLYLYPSGLTDPLVDAICETGVPYFDLSLQHVSRPLLAAMRRPGDAERFLARIEQIREREPAATFRSSFILGYPGETEQDQRRLVQFLEAAQLDWAGFFAFSSEQGTLAATLPAQVPAELAAERLAECSEVQDAITARRREAMVGQTLSVLVDAPGRARSVGEAPEIDGVVRVPEHLAAGRFHDVEVVEATGTDLRARVAG